MTIPALTWYYGWTAETPPRYVALNPGDEIPEELLIALTPAAPILAGQDPGELFDELTNAMAPGAVLAQASALAGVAASDLGITVAQAAAMIDAGPADPIRLAPSLG